MTHHQLPPNPLVCGSLTDPDVARLKARYPDLWCNPVKTCLTCLKEKDGIAAFKTKERGEVVTYDCACVEQWRLHRWLLNSGIDMRYQRYSWDDVNKVSEEVQLKVMGYLENAASNINSGEGMTLWSSTFGTGKTLLGSLLLKGLLADGHDGYFTQFLEMIDTFTAGWRNEQERVWFIRRVRNAGVLVIDDMGKESKGRGNVIEPMFDSVIRARVAACKPTIITTNYTPAEMLQGYGGNVLSLLSEVNTEVEVAGADYRPLAKEKMRQNRRDGITFPIVVR